ncbi:MAG: sigma-70 family RNA polymerase sigma factor [Planctomycetaceae bacterium]|nr:sigma-70 family RNA polymerase sigma factor [Planctomycetaceae bacterium]
MTEDDLLMIRLQDGESPAFETLVEKYQPELIGFFYKNTRDRQLAEDLSQETMLKVYRMSWDYLPTGRFRGWMYRIARNLMIDDYRRRSGDALLHAKADQREDTQALSHLMEEMIPAEVSADRAEFSAIVDDLLPEIPDDQRQTFLLHYYSGLSLPEVAEIMECEVATSKSRLRLAREKLRDKLRLRGISSDHFDP